MSTPTEPSAKGYASAFDCLGAKLLIVLLLQLALTLALPQTVVAHDFAPATVHVSYQAPDVSVVWTLPAGVDAQCVHSWLPDQARGCVATPNSEATPIGAQRALCASTLRGSVIEMPTCVRAMVVLATWADDAGSTSSLVNGEWHIPVDGGSLPASFEAGWKHIVAGWDHLLFILALALWAVRCADRPAARVLIAISAFTCGHMISLWGVTSGGVAVNPTLIEFGIAASIAALAAEAAMAHRDDATSGKRRNLEVFVFAGIGVLHGAGIGTVAAVEGWRFAGLAGFALSIEAVQASVAVVATFLFTRGPLKNDRLQFYGCYLAGSIAGWLTIDRAIDAIRQAVA